MSDIRKKLEGKGILLIPSQRIELMNQKEKYDKYKDSIKKEINWYKNEILLSEKDKDKERAKNKINWFNREISDLVNELSSRIPSIQGAEYIHEGGGCGLKSILKIKESENSKPEYFCLYCDKEV